MLTLNYDQAHDFVVKQRKLGSDVRWEGWDLVLWKPTHHGFTNRKGAFRNKRWGMETRITVGRDGTWKVPARNVKSAK